MTKEERKIIEKHFGVYEYENGYELEQWTNCGVNMIIYIDKNNNKNFIEQFKSYIDSFDIDSEIDMYRQDSEYKEVFTIKDSLEDFESWLDYCNNILKELKAVA